MKGSAETLHKQPIMDYAEVRNNLNACGRQEKELCLKCKYYGSKQCHLRLILEAATAITNLMRERGYDGDQRETD